MRLGQGMTSDMTPYVDNNQHNAFFVAVSLNQVVELTVSRVGALLAPSRALPSDAQRP